MNTLTLCIDEGDLEIQEADLPSITDVELAQWRISREELHRCFARGVEVMRDLKPSERLRPIAFETSKGEWEVHLCERSATNDPLMQGPALGSA